jgi:hypothetical protein
MGSVQLIVGRGHFVPADEDTKLKLRTYGFAIGEIVNAKITKPRNPRFHNMVHRLGRLCVENIDGFESLDGHQAIKRLQYETGAGCDEFLAQVPNVGEAMIRVPKSLSFSEMDDVEFHELYQAICRHLAAVYWPTMNAKQVERMAELIE